MKRGSSDKGFHGYNPDSPEGSDSSFGTPSGTPASRQSAGRTPPCDKSQAEFDFPEIDLTFLESLDDPNKTMTGSQPKGGKAGKGLTPLKHVPATTADVTAVGTEAATIQVTSQTTATTSTMNAAAPSSSRPPGPGLPAGTNVPSTFRTAINPVSSASNDAEVATTTQAVVMTTQASPVVTTKDVITPPTVDLSTALKSDQLRDLRTACNTSVTATYDWMTKIQRELTTLPDCERTFLRWGELLLMSMDVEKGMNTQTKAYADSVRPVSVSRAVQAIKEADHARKNLEDTRTVIKVKQMTYLHSKDTVGETALLRSKERSDQSTLEAREVARLASLENDIAVAKAGSRDALNTLHTALWYKRAVTEVMEAASHMEATRLHLLEQTGRRQDPEAVDEDLQYLLADMANSAAEALAYIAAHQTAARNIIVQSGSQPVVSAPTQMTGGGGRPAVTSQSYAEVVAPINRCDLTIYNQLGLNDSVDTSIDQSGSVPTTTQGITTTTVNQMDLTMQQLLQTSSLAPTTESRGHCTNSVYTRRTHPYDQQRQAENAPSTVMTAATNHITNTSWNSPAPPLHNSTTNWGNVSHQQHPPGPPPPVDLTQHNGHPFNWQPPSQAPTYGTPAGYPNMTHNTINALDNQREQQNRTFNGNGSFMSTQSPAPNFRGMKLESIKLPPFTGEDISKYFAFKQHFTAYVHSRDQIPVEEKMARLLTATMGGPAYDLISDFTCDEAG
jgi:hypothetical protein